MIAIAHRGASGHAPENTVKAFRLALEFGAPYIELDVYFVHDELIVIHDDTLDRTTNGKGTLASSSFSELRRLDAGDGERIPLLQEVIELVQRRAVINIELKGPHTAAPVMALIERYVAQGWKYEDFLLSSFDHRQLIEAKKANKKIRIGPLIVGVLSDYAKFAEDIQAYSVHPSVDFLPQEFVEDAHRRNLKVFAFTANSQVEIERLCSLGVDGVFTDFPEKVLRSEAENDN